MPKLLTNFLIDPDLLEGLRFVRDRDGVGIGEQIRRAVRTALEDKGVLPLPGTKGGGVKRTKQTAKRSGRR